ncbi:MAG: sensor histidine kinase, partial [Polyangiales bacterium]
MSQPDFRSLFESTPGLYLVIEPNAPRYTIVAMSDAYARATMKNRADMIGRDLFEVFPDNPADPEASGVRNATASLERVLRTRAPDRMPIQRHDVPRPGDGVFEERFWRPVNSPIFSASGELVHILHCVEDVTELVREERAGKSKDDWFRQLFESAIDGIFVATAEGRYTDVNAAGCRIVGYSREELIGLSIRDLVAPEDLARQDMLRRRILEGGIEVSEWKLRRKNGTFVHVEIGASTLPDRHLLAFVRDVSDRVAAEERLRLSERKFSSIVSSSADAIIAIDQDQRITLFNEGATKIFGYTKEESIGAPLEMLIPARLRPMHRRHVEHFASGQETARRMGTRSAPIIGLRKNGEEFAADAAISLVRVDGNRQLTVSVRDISEQKRIDDELALLAEMGQVLIAAGSDSERVLADAAELLVRNVADWCAVDLVHERCVRRVRLVHADPARATICEALERRPLVRGRPSAVFDAVDTRRSVLVSDVRPEYLESVAEDRTHLQLMRALETKSFMVVPLVAREQVLGTLALGSSQPSRTYGPRDLREAEQLARALALALDNARLHEALERAVRARDEVLGIVAHDLRNPLNTIILNSRLLQRATDQEAPTRIHRAAHRMNRLIQDLLDVSRLEAGQPLSIGQESVATASVIDEALQQQRPLIAEAGRTLNLDVGAAPKEVWADRARLVQVLDNLIGNAVKFSRTSIT